MDEETRQWLCSNECEVGTSVKGVQAVDYLWFNCSFEYHTFSFLLLKLVMQEYAEEFVLHGYTNKHFLAGIKAKVRTSSKSLNKTTCILS
jgi:hypothetical protein